MAKDSSRHLTFVAIILLCALLGGASSVAAENRSIILASPAYLEAAEIIAEAHVLREWSPTILVDDWSSRSVDEIRGTIAQQLSGGFGKRLALGIGTWDRNWEFGGVPEMEEYAVFPAAYGSCALGNSPGYLDEWPVYAYVNEDTFRVSLPLGRQSIWCRLPVWTPEQAMDYALKDLAQAELAYDPVHDHRVPWFIYNEEYERNAVADVDSLTQLLLDSQWLPGAPWEFVARRASEITGGPDEREQLVVDELNFGVQLAFFGLSTSSSPWHLTRWTVHNWINVFDLERLSEQPAGYFPVLLVPSCDVSRFDTWHIYWQPGVVFDDQAITSKLLLAPDAGVLAIVGPTTNTTQISNYYAADAILRAIFQIGTECIGEAVQRARRYLEIFYSGDGEWSLIDQSTKNITILGDGTIELRGLPDGSVVDERLVYDVLPWVFLMPTGLGTGRLQFWIPKGEVAEIDVVDVTGRLVWSTAVRGTGDIETVCVQGGQGRLASGIYSARLTLPGAGTCVDTRVVILR
ncbi:MAG: hypothetical protein KAY24_09870 [Candidatus Eisenbacteria sp.]|nr:hypothetical protein [Candidatus Eisenbacteria bacterium]